MGGCGSKGAVAGVGEGIETPLPNVGWRLGFMQDSVGKTDASMTLGAAFASLQAADASGNPAMGNCTVALAAPEKVPWAHVLNALSDAPLKNTAATQYVWIDAVGLGNNGPAWAPQSVAKLIKSCPEGVVATWSPPTKPLMLTHSSSLWILLSAIQHGVPIHLSMEQDERADLLKELPEYFEGPLAKIEALDLHHTTPDPLQPGILAHCSRLQGGVNNINITIRTWLIKWYLNMVRGMMSERMSSLFDEIETCPEYTSVSSAMPAEDDDDEDDDEDEPDASSNHLSNVDSKMSSSYGKGKSSDSSFSPDAKARVPAAKPQFSRAYRKRFDADIKWALLAQRVAHMLAEAKDYDGSQAMTTMTIDICTKLRAPHHVVVARALNTKAVVMQNLVKTDHTGAIQACEQAMEALEKGEAKSVSAGVGPSAKGQWRDRSTVLDTFVLSLRAQERYSEAEQKCRAALKLKERHLGDSHIDVANTLNSLAVLLKYLDDLEGAEVLHRRCLGIREQRLPPNHPDLAASCTNLAIILQQVGKKAESEALFKRSLEMRDQLVLDAGGQSDDQASIDSLHNLARLMEDQGDFAEAEKIYRDVWKALARVCGEVSPQVAIQLANVAHMRKKQSDFEEAETLFLQAIEIEEKIMASRQNTADGRVVVDKVRESIVGNLSQVANLMARDGRYQKAEVYARRVVKMHEDAGEDADVEAHRDSYHMLAGILEEQGEILEATSMYEKELAIEQSQISRGAHPHVASRLGHLGRLKEMLSDEGHDTLDEAEEYYKQSVRMWSATTGDDEKVLIWYAVLLKKRKRFEDSAGMYLRVLNLMNQTHGAEYVTEEKVVLLNNLAGCLLRSGKLDEAEPHYRNAMVATRQLVGEMHEHYSVACNNLANLCKRQGKSDESEKLYRRSLEITQQVLGETHPNVAHTYHNLGKLMEKDKKPRAAIENYTLSLQVDEKNIGPNDSRLLGTLTKLAELHMHEGDKDLGAEYHKRATDLAITT